MRWGALALAVAALAVLTACGGAHPASPEPRAGAVEAALEARLDAKLLTYRWVVCVRTRRAFAGEPIFRCNVNFGEPHIVRYCATLSGERLVTNREERAMRCGRETAS